MYLMLILLAFVGTISAADNVITVPLGQSKILEFDEQVTRIAIANPATADATVISSYQILVTGKSIGTTSLVVWDASMDYAGYKIIVQNEPSSSQIMLEVCFLEVDKTVLHEFGSDFLIKQMKAGSERIDVGSFGGKVGTPSDPLSLSSTVDFLLSIPTQNFALMLKALEDNNFISILATPNLSAISGSEASFLAGGEFPIPIVSGSMGMQTVTIQFKEYGVRLKFLPTVLDSNVVNIKVTAEVSSLDFENGVTLSGFQIPSLVTRKAETTVELDEGQYLVMGGLLSNDLSETLSRIPVLGHIPVLGKLFSSKRYMNRESELLITLSPRIISPLSKEEIPELHLKKEKK